MSRWVAFGGEGGDTLQLDAYLHQHLAPHGHDSPVIWTDLVAEWAADIAIHWLTHDPDGQTMCRTLASTATGAELVANG